MERRQAFAMLRRFRPYLRSTWKYVWGIFALKLFQVPIAIVAPLIIKTVVDDAVADASKERLYQLAGILAVLTLVNVLLGLAISYFNLIYRVKLFHRIRLVLFRHLQKLSLSYFDDKETGYLMSRQLDDVGGLGGVMPDLFAGAAVDVLRALAFAFMLLFIEWRMAVGALLFAAGMFGFQYLISGPLRRLSRDARERWSQVTSSLHQAISGHLLTQTTASEARERRRFAHALHQGMRSTLKADLFGLWTGRLVALVAGLVQPLIILVATLLIVSTDFTVGALFAFFLYLQHLVSAVTAVAGVNPSMQASLSALERIYEVLDSQPEVESPADGVKVGRLEGRVRFEGVSFEYVEGRPVLEGVDLDVPPRTMVALVGPSGAGKTTMARLIPRFYDPNEGRVLVDGRDLRELDLGSYRKQIGIVPQDIFLFDRTVAENIAIGRPRASPEEIRRAADAANATGFIEGLEDGFDTLIGERGVRLSGGQRQRLAIARELLRDPSILILDEATSSLDSESEALIQQALDVLLRDRTSFVIAHRLSTIMKADRILVLDGGHVVNSGRHHELLEDSELYSRLYRSQFEPRDRRDPREALPAAGSVEELGSRNDVAAPGPGTLAEVG